jgi:hypothetical protein
VGAEPPPPEGAASGGEDKPDAPDDLSDSEAEKSLGDEAQEGSEERGSDEEDDEGQEEEEEQGEAEDWEEEEGSVAAEGEFNEGAHLDEDRGEEREEEAQQEEQEGEEEARSLGPATSDPTPGHAATPCCGGQPCFGPASGCAAMRMAGQRMEPGSALSGVSEAPGLLQAPCGSCPPASSARALSGESAVAHPSGLTSSLGFCSPPVTVLRLAWDLRLIAHPV